jgi:hypothetical protein
MRGRPGEAAETFAAKKRKSRKKIGSVYAPSVLLYRRIVAHREESWIKQNKQEGRKEREEQIAFLPELPGLPVPIGL